MGTALAWGESKLCSRRAAAACSELHFPQGSARATPTSGGGSKLLGSGAGWQGGGRRAGVAGGVSPSAPAG